MTLPDTPSVVSQGPPEMSAPELARSGPAEESKSVSDLGARVRQLRKMRKVSLAKLSAATGVSVAMLSHIELGKATPSLKVLDRLRVALGVSMVDLFPEPPSADEGVACPIVRAGDRVSLHFEQIGLTKQRLSPGEKSDLELLFLVIEPGGSSGPERWTRVGEKAGMVVAGAARLEIADKAFDLGVGDSFQFDSSKPHRFEALGDQVVHIIWIIKSNPLAKAVDA